MARKEKASAAMKVAGAASRASLMGGPGGSSSGQQRSRWGTVEQEDTIDKNNQDLLQMQSQIMRQQDDGLDVLAQTVARQKELGQAINRELDEQMPLLDRLDRHVDTTGAAVQKETRRVIRLTRKSAAGGGFCCLVFCIILFAALAATDWGCKIVKSKSRC